MNWTHAKSSLLNWGNKYFLNSGVDQDESSSECESSDSDEEEVKDDNVNYFGANFHTSNHITFTDLDEIKRLAFSFSFCYQTFVEEIIICKKLC